MSEGEFKKRIHAMCPPYEEVYMSDEGEENRDLGTLLKLIEEAKQEFPKPEDYAMPNGVYKTGWIGEINGDKTKWFWKWFGTTGEKE